jgi:hypothetical protein
MDIEKNQGEMSVVILILLKERAHNRLKNPLDSVMT